MEKPQRRPLDDVHKELLGNLKKHPYADINRELIWGKIMSIKMPPEECSSALLAIFTKIITPRRRT